MEVGLEVKGAGLEELQSGGGSEGGWEGLKEVTCVILQGVLWSSGSRGRGRDPTRRSRLGHRLAGLLAARTSFCTNKLPLRATGSPCLQKCTFIFSISSNVLLSPPPWGTCLAFGFMLTASRPTWNGHLNDVAIRRFGFDPLGRETIS